MKDIYATYSDPIEKAIQKYKYHASISIIHKMVSTVDKNNTFELRAYYCI